MKKLVSISVILTLILSALTLTACNGAGLFHSPSEGLEYAFYEVDGEKTCEITGVGTFHDSVLRIGNQKDGYKILGIAARAFENCTFITEIYISSNVESISERAFAGCTFLQTIHYGNHLRSLGAEVFAGCVLLEDIDLSGTNLRNLGAGCFSGCISIESVSFSKSIVNIGADCFKDCDKISSVHFDYREGWWAGDEHIYVNDDRIAARYLTEDYQDVAWSRDENFDFFEYWINKVKGLLD